MSGPVTQALPRHEQWEITGPDPVLMVLFGVNNATRSDHGVFCNG